MPGLKPDASSNARRQLGFWQATALVVGHTIGVGIFITPAELAAVGAPGFTLGLWLVCGALIFAGALTFGELAARYPRAGGIYVYLREGWSERAAFLYGWQSMLVMDPGITAALAVGGAPYAAVLWPGAGDSEPWIPLAMIWIPTLIAIAGFALSARVMTALTVLKVTALVAVIVVGFTRADGSFTHFTATGATMGLGSALAIGLATMFFAYGGFWEAGRIADAVRQPGRTMPLALGAGVLLVTAIYLATTAVFVYLVPPGGASSAAAFARLAGEAMFGPVGPPILSAIVLVSVAASIIALLIMAPRLYVAMSAAGLLPARFEAGAGPTGVPIAPTLLLAVIATLFTLVGTFRTILGFFMCSTLTFVAMAAATLVPLRRKAPHASDFLAPAHPLPTYLFVALLGGVIALIGFSQPLQALAGVVVIAAGVPAFALVRHRGLSANRPVAPGVER